MMLNLFSIFDSYTGSINNWISSLLGLMLVPQIYWVKKFRIFFFIFNIMKILWGEIVVIFKLKYNINNSIYFIVLFFYIMFNNFMGLFPYVFTSSSHLIFSMIFSFSMWVGMMLYGWLNNFKIMLMHLVPLSTPFGLMFFMVLIELLSSLIRPLTLCIRLVANMIAGHLLLTLLSMFIPESIFLYLIILMLQIILFVLEMSVSFIQSYVFMILLTLYLKESN